MRKHELIHLHALLRTLADRLRAAGAVDDDGLAPYRSLGISPMSLQASRDDHEAAVLCLSGVLAAAVTTDVAVHEDPSTERPSDSAESADATEPPVG